MFESIEQQDWSPPERAGAGRRGAARKDRCRQCGCTRIIRWVDDLQRTFYRADPDVDPIKYGPCCKQRFRSRPLRDGLGWRVQTDQMDRVARRDSVRGGPPRPLPMPKLGEDLD